MATRDLTVYPPQGVGIGVRKIEGLSTTDCSREVDIQRVSMGVLSLYPPQRVGIRVSTTDYSRELDPQRLAPRVL